ncbi:MAG: hypothetical protein K2X77_28870 [Candidatus Obscuribacterales bacterium]|nr:hypothetical protein [Candidatus Obscuribacterales bacterium]
MNFRTVDRVVGEDRMQTRSDFRHGKRACSAITVLVSLVPNLDWDAHRNEPPAKSSQSAGREAPV